MTHLMEPVSVLPPVSKETHDEHCAFCKDAKAKGKTSHIGKDNDSGTLEDNLTAKGFPRRTFKHPSHGDFSSEPHHLLPGNEALKGHEIEKWLAETVSGSEVEADTGFDINSHYNGEWMPSVPKSLVGKSGWSWSDPECMEKAIAVMTREGLQFHKGGHTNKGGLDKASSEPERCYIKKVEGQLDKLVEHIEEWKNEFCPIEKDKTDKSRPPFYLNDLMYGVVSSRMMQEVSGPPEKWQVFISRVAYAAHLEAKEKEAKQTLKREAADQPQVQPTKKTHTG